MRPRLLIEYGNRSQLVSLTWLREPLNGVHDIQSVALPGDDQVELLEGLAVYHQWVALGGQGLLLHTQNVVIQQLQNIMYSGIGKIYNVFFSGQSQYIDG